MAVCSVSATIDYRHDAFQAKLPAIQRSASYFFRHLTPQRKQDAMDEAAAAAWKLWHGMIRKGTDPTEVTAAALAHWACCHVRRDSRVSCERGGGRGKRDLFHAKSGAKPIAYSELKDYYIADRRAAIPDIVATKLDFASWLLTRSERDRQVCLALASGAATSEVAEQFKISAARVSQIRCEARASWEAYNEA
ncbi:MAG TPA: hypothetical protein VGZ22_28870 [Isosphaeraceae bacterium]|nr:hypothetical protein [Isosphaeraceae bacterium]